MQAILTITNIAASIDGSGNSFAREEDVNISKGVELDEGCGRVETSNRVKSFGRSYQSYEIEKREIRSGEEESEDWQEYSRKVV